MRNNVIYPNFSTNDTRAQIDHVPYNSRPAWMLWTGGLTIGLAAPHVVNALVIAFTGLVDLLDRTVTMVIEIVWSVPL